MAQKRIEIKLDFIGDGRIVERPHGFFRGGVVDPEVSSEFGFNVLPVSENDEPDLQSYAGTLQINMWGTSADYRELGRYLLGIAELDSAADPEFHQHHHALMSSDGRARLDLIVRKPQLR